MPAFGQPVRKGDSGCRRHVERGGIDRQLEPAEIALGAFGGDGCVRAQVGGEVVRGAKFGAGVAHRDVPQAEVVEVVGGDTDLLVEFPECGSRRVVELVRFDVAADADPGVGDGTGSTAVEEQDTPRRTRKIDVMWRVACGVM